MSNRKFVVCMKCYRGGEWLDASLESVMRHTDGAVIVLSTSPWAFGKLKENCSDVIDAFRAEYPEYPIVVKTGQYKNSDDQYRLALSTIVERFGEDSAAMIVDSDEVWEEDNVERLRDAVMTHPQKHYFLSGIRSYLRSPLYQVWPLEGTHCVVALRHCRPQTINSRFSTRSEGAALPLPDIDFHHYTYVRLDNREIGHKFLNTSSQERVASDRSWLDVTWKQIPLGTNLHMTPGCESAWKRIACVTPDAIPVSAADSKVVRVTMCREELRWREALRTLKPDVTVIPTPSNRDIVEQLHADNLRQRLPNANKIIENLKVTCGEARWLAYFATVYGERILEVGVGHGGSTACMALASNSKHIHTVDPFLPYDEETYDGVSHGAMEGDEAKFWKLAKQCGYADRVTHHKVKSESVRDEIDGMKFTLAFSDANHSYATTANDLALCWDALEPGGILVQHDYTTRFPGVIRAVDEFEAKVESEIVGNSFRCPGLTSIAYAVKKGHGVS